MLQSRRQSLEEDAKLLESLWHKPSRAKTKRSPYVTERTQGLAGRDAAFARRTLAAQHMSLTSTDLSPSSAKSCQNILALRNRQLRAGASAVIVQFKPGIAAQVHITLLWICNSANFH